MPILSIALDIALGMNVLELMGITHRDLKPQNCLVFLDGVVKIADFGIARDQENENTPTLDCGTYKYSPPESVDIHELHRFDTWSFGCTIADICKSNYMSDFVDVTVPADESLKSRWKTRRDDCLSRRPEWAEGLWEVLIPCLSGDQLARPSFVDLVSKIFKLQQGLEEVLGCNIDFHREVSLLMETRAKK